jgi:Ca2+-binding RTX toxin-like protein
MVPSDRIYFRLKIWFWKLAIMMFASSLLSLMPTISVVLAIDINGGPRPDNIKGTTKDDDIRGHNGDDIIDGLQGNDEIQGEQGNDILNGSEGMTIYPVAPASIRWMVGREMMN